LVVPAALLRSEQDHRPAAGAELSLRQRDEALARPALVSGSGTGREPDVGRPRRQSAQGGLAPRRIEAERETGLDPLAAGYGDEIHELIDQPRRACIVPGRPLVGKQEARGAGDEGRGADPAQDEGGEHAPLRVEDEIEATTRQRRVLTTLILRRIRTRTFVSGAARFL